MSVAPDQIAAFRTEAPRRWGNITPYRVGLLVGSAGAVLVCPYSDRRAALAFESGRLHGARSPLRRDDVAGATGEQRAQA